MARTYSNPGKIVRFAFASATIVFGLLGLALGARRLLAAAGAFGLLWTAWDVIWNRVLAPFGQWAASLLTEGAGGPPPNTRPTIDDTIRLLESHLEHGASRSVEIQAAIRLEELYRAVRKDPVRAREVTRRITAKYPQAPELERFREGDDE